MCKTAASDISAPQPSGARQEQSDGDFLSSGRSPQAQHRAPAATASGRPVEFVLNVHAGPCSAMQGVDTSAATHGPLTSTGSSCDRQPVYLCSCCVSSSCFIRIEALLLQCNRCTTAAHEVLLRAGRDWRQPLEDCEPYLDGLRVYVACAAPSEFMELVSICREGGACRYPRLDPLITHIVVRSCSMSHMLLVLQFSLHFRGPDTVSAALEAVGITTYCGMSHSCLWD